MFKTRVKAKNITTIIRNHKIYVTPLALYKMRLYVEESAEEVGWLGVVDELEENVFLISDVMLFKQEVSGTSCDLSEESLQEFAEELMQTDAGCEAWNKIRFWGHSHVRMAVNPSGTDVAQLMSFEQNGHPYFLSAIGNKSGELEFAYIDFEKGYKVNDVNWEIYSDLDKDGSIAKAVKAELKSKVTKKVYSFPGNIHYTGGHSGYGRDPYAPAYGNAKHSPQQVGNYGQTLAKKEVSDWYDDVRIGSEQSGYEQVDISGLETPNVSAMNPYLGEDDMGVDAGDILMEACLEDGTLTDEDMFEIAIEDDEDVAVDALMHISNFSVDEAKLLFQKFGQLLAGGYFEDAEYENMTDEEREEQEDDELAITDTDDETL